MVAEELVSWSPRLRSRLRIVGPIRQDGLPVALREYLMPFDTRLDDPDGGRSGTASDFPHRALRHFVLDVLPGRLDKGASVHARRVEASLAKLTAPVRVRGRSTSDDEVMAVVRAMWKEHGGRRYSMLRELRSTQLIACEQSRFKGLVDKVEARLNGARTK
jgi:hypothetical protein